jgi:2-polyprenyl-3-methyl-5-hydroxy-6-metoxy-1,4-benzoquinol methylase
MAAIDNKANYRSRTLVDGYDAHRRISEADDYVNRLEVDYFTAAARRLAGPSGSVIDFGAGTGKLSLAFARLGYAVTALDQSEAMLERLQAKAAAEGLAIDCRLADIVADASLAPAAPTHDVAVSSRVLMHVADPAVMIGHMAALARRGIVFDAPRRRSPNSLLVALRARAGGEVYRCFDDAAVRALVAGAGLTLLDATGLFTLPIGLHLALGRPVLSRLLEAAAAPARSFASSLFVTAERPS